MKIILYLIFAFPVIVRAQQTYRVSGQVDELQDGDKIYFSYHLDGELHKDSTVAKNHRFTFFGKINKQAKGSLSARENPFSDIDILHNSLTLYVEPGQINVISKDSLKYALITGTTNNNDYTELTAILKPYYKELRNVNDSFDKLSPEQQKNVDNIAQQRKQYYAVLAQMAPLKMAFVARHPNSYISFATLRDMLNQWDANSIDSAFNTLAPGLKNSSEAKSFALKLASAKRSALGTTAPNFLLPDAKGQLTSLQDYRGKYVLIDFWASWCLPCRQENPNVKAAFERFKNKNFTVLSLSIDDSGARKSWLKAISEDGLPWPQLLDATKKVHDSYGVTYIPANFLIDPNGKIIAKNLKDTALTDKLSELLNK
ncbi:AhpC/TSA family protein [Mucilaginibacter terrenus]|uniref:AhpC/TSA family protein n=1 Tax=Mucilaginibacter terrenus TaxID=2482727 RepID=A0A3E2NJY6_9SPHI|nr:TlpA disulfide reductase family protein [Mucilaginibacter terrenus]RFZ81233.1 AhpC/TSA family protein [Mucilaginibacter terrenus]